MGWLHLFAGIPAERPYDDMETKIHRVLIDMESTTITLDLNDVENIARRLAELRDAALESASGWIAPPNQPRQDVTTYTALLPRQDDALDKLRAAIEDQLGPLHDPAHDFPDLLTWEDEGGRVT